MTWTRDNCPSVTQVLGIYQDFSGVPAHRLAYAADRGTRVHSACAAIALGAFMPALDIDIEGYVESFRKWFESSVESICAVERRLVHPRLGYHGQPDLICRVWGDHDLTVIDYKTPAQKQRVWAAQVAAYAALAEANMYGTVWRGASLRLDSTGRQPKFDQYRVKHEDLAAFVQALGAYRYFKMEDK